MENDNTLLDFDDILDSVFKEKVKICKECKNETALGSHCEYCGASLSENKKNISYSEPGRGRKQCKCKIYLPTGVKVCHLCGNNFDEFIPEVELTTEQQQFLNESRRVGYSKRDLFVIAPSGECPAKLKGISKDELYAWIEKVVYAGKKKNLFYTSTAIKYWARQELDSKCLSKDEIVNVYSIITDWYEDYN